MLRAVLLGIAVPALAAACALVSPEPAGTRPVQLTIRNNTGSPVNVRVTTPAGGAANSAVPAVVPIGALGTPVTIYVPVVGEWALELGDQAQIPGTDFDEYTAQGCMFGVELDRGGAYSYGCLDEL